MKRRREEAQIRAEREQVRFRGGRGAGLVEATAAAVTEVTTVTLMAMPTIFMGETAIFMVQ